MKDVTRGRDISTLVICFTEEIIDSKPVLGRKVRRSLKEVFELLDRVVEMPSFNLLMP